MRKILILTAVLWMAVFYPERRQLAIADSLPNQNQATAPELVLQTGHGKSVRAAVFAPDKKWVATGSLDNSIRIWNAETGRELRSLNGHVGSVLALAGSPDGSLLASGGIDNSIRIWEVSSGKEVRRFDNINGTVETVAFSPDGGLIAFGGSEKTVDLRNAVTGDTVWKEQIHLGSVTSLAFSPDGKLVASGGVDGLIKVRDILKRKIVGTMKGHSEPIRSLSFSSDGATLGSASQDKTVRLWRASGDREILKFQAPNGSMLAVHFSDRNAVIFVDADRAVRSTSIAVKRGTPTPLAACHNPLGATEMASFSRDGAFLALGNGDGTVSICDAATGELRTTLENHTNGSYRVDISPDQHWLASASFDNTVKVWDLRTGQSLPPLKGHGAKVTSVVFSPGGQIISGSLDNSIRVWDPVGNMPPKALSGHTDTIQSIAVSGELIVSGSSDETIGLWDLRTGSPLRFLRDHKGEVTCVSIDMDGKRIASGGIDGSIKIWEATSSKPSLTLDGRGRVEAVSISRDGKLVAAGGSDQKVRVWDAETGRLVSTLSGHHSTIYSVAFNRDATQVVSAGRDKTVRIWNVAEERETGLLKDHEGTVYSAVLSSDQRFIVSGSDDGSVILWGTESRRQLARLITIKEGLDWLVVTPNGFFDGSSAAWEQLSWRFDNDTFSVRPVEVFFDEFFTPGLLADLIKEAKAPAGSSISTRDRRQPIVELSFPETSGAKRTDREIKVAVTVTDGGFGARDVRLFRNGSLVEIWRGDVLQGQHSFRLQTTVRVVAGENRFTAYAFNADNVKSRDARGALKGAPSLGRKGVFYVLAIGINDYANKEFNLDYAVVDAKDVSDEIRKQQSQLGIYEKVEVVDLVNKAATKNGILNSIREISAKIGPEDVLLIFYAGHGKAYKDRFYLIPHDLGFSGRRSELDSAGFQTIFDNSISDIEFERAVEKIDSRQIVFVIDACNSGQVLEASEKRRGPMNSKGLAQLAYEKGMYILTASQSYEDANEADRLGHGLLTFALVEEGLKNTAADKDPKDGRVLIREWLEYATGRVPQIQENEIKARKLVRDENRKASINRRDELQRPRVFYRRDAELDPLVVAGRAVK